MPRPTDEVRQLLVHPVVWPPLLSWLKARNIELSAQQFGDDDLPTYVMTPSTVTTEVGRDQLDTYVRIFKQLPRETVAELVAAVTTDPALHGRRTALAQAAMLVSVGHRLGWHDALPAVVPGGTGEEPAHEKREAEAHPPTHMWKVESPRRDQWASWGGTHDERVWAAASYDDVIEVAPQRPFRLVRATTTYAVEAEHQPAAGPAGGAQQPKTPPTVGYSGKGRVWCLRCPHPADEDVPVTGREVSDWEICASCGRHVLDVARWVDERAAAQQPKEA